jgi:two-component system KDP operon response regulator KdpE
MTMPQPPAGLRILVVDDEPAMVGAVTALVGTAGHQVITAYDGDTALRRFEDEAPDLVLLDLAMPGRDGVDVCREIRKTSRTPIIVLTGEADELAKVEALDAGADDYVTKPFGMEELLARTRAALRRSGVDEPSQPTLTFGALEIDLPRRLVTNDGAQVHLTPTEYSLLEALVTNPGKLLTHQWLLRRVWGQGYGTETTYLRTYVRTLRRKLSDDASAPALIVTEPGVGYRWTGEQTA